MKNRRERGAVLVETAILIPLLVVLVMGIADLGRAFAAQITVRSAASEGALYGSMFPNVPADIQNRLIAAGGDLGLVAADITVLCPGDKIQVLVEHDVSMITFVGQWFGSSISLEAQSTGTVVSSATCTPS